MATTAAQRVRKQEQERAAELGELVTSSAQRTEEADARREQVVSDVRKRWNAAMEALWDERWMRECRFPDPDPEAEPADPDEARRAVHDAFLELRGAVEKPKRQARGVLGRRKPRDRP
nr:hypothetical protein [Saccharopolyspora sp. HNM0983]